MRQLDITTEVDAWVPDSPPEGGAIGCCACGAVSTIEQLIASYFKLNPKGARHSIGCPCGAPLVSISGGDS